MQRTPGEHPTLGLVGSLSPPRVLSPSLCALRDREDDGRQAPEAPGAASWTMPDQPAPGAGPQGAAPEPPRESTPRDKAQGIPCVPAPGPDGASPVMPESSADVRLLKAQALPTEEGSSVTRRDPSHPAKPPRSKATKGPGQEPEGRSSAPWDPSLAKASPDSPKGTSVPEQDDQATDSHPERPLPADCKLGVPSVDASPLPKRTACPSLQEATRLIQEEFAFDGYLDNGLEALIMGIEAEGPLGSPDKPQDQGEAVGGHSALGEGQCVGELGPPHVRLHEEFGGQSRAQAWVQQQSLGQEEGLRAQPPSPGVSPSCAASRNPEGMLPHRDWPLPFCKPGEYIYALKDLTYATFCGAISEKFCDLYWGEKLLQSLFKVVNGRTSPSEK